MNKPCKKSDFRFPALKRRKPIKGMKRPKKAPSISKLIQRSDALFSIKTRMKGAFKVDGSDEWSNRCYTCGKVFSVKKLHAGHYLSRFYKSARWDEDNARPQCMMCNMWKRGDPVVFRQNLIEEIGIERVEAVEAKRHEVVKMSREYLEDLIKKLSTCTYLHKRIYTID